MPLDKNHDGFLDKSEVPERMQKHFDETDTNKDGKVTLEEVKAFFAAHKRPQ